MPHTGAMGTKTAPKDDGAGKGGGGGKVQFHRASYRYTQKFLPAVTITLSTSQQAQPLAFIPTVGFLNGKLRQSSNTRHLIFSVPFLVCFISWIMTLLPGDVITTGTPAGVGPMQPGDRVDVQIEGIGTLSNTVRQIR